ncbi:ras-related protein rab-24 [Anaeramoeba flamelloides]|uniref:Ras-related protein rab-24 n=1 Tax=Anaeramoeba flamelloides TaxID=1746091 RepID=A0AAV7YMS7_9EUKA|nr:ras-related protein rab-24 [Anaeramoeba flamelloides]
MSMEKVDMKVVLLGNSYAGKTCLINRYLNNEFTESERQTIAVSFSSKKVFLSKKSITMGIWDTAGAEKFASMSKMYYRKAHAAIVCYEVKSRESYEKLKFWVDQLRKNEEHCVIFIAETKVDQLGENVKRAVPEKEMNQYAQSINARVVQTSAKTNLGINQLFLSIARDFMEKEKYWKEIKQKKKQSKQSKQTNNEPQKLRDEIDFETKKSCC